MKSILPRSLNARIFWGVLLGSAIGWWVGSSGSEYAIASSVLYVAKLVGTLFLDLLRMLLVPLIFSSLVVGVANLRAHQQMHRVWMITLGFFVLSMAIAILIGFAAAHWFRPGEGMQLGLLLMQPAISRHGRCLCLIILPNFYMGYFRIR